MSASLFETTSSPLLGLMRARWFPREDRVLVFLAEDRPDCVEPTRGDDTWGYPRPSWSEVREGGFSHVCWVSLTERVCWVDLHQPAGAAAWSPFSRRVGWRVCDPVAVVRNRVVEAGVPRLVATHVRDHVPDPGPRHLHKQPPPPCGTVPVSAHGAGQMLPEGIGYVFLEASPGEETGPVGAGAPEPPAAWGEAHREMYHFYREVVAGGPAGLAALWLLHQPEQAREVLDWTVGHPQLLSGAGEGPAPGGMPDEDSWETTLARTLRGLSGEERGFLGVRIAEVLSSMGVPQGDEVLERIGAATAPGR